MKIAERFQVKKVCDRCGKIDKLDFKIKRCSFTIQFPNYEYFAFDLCPNCILVLDHDLIKFFNNN